MKFILPGFILLIAVAVSGCSAAPHRESAGEFFDSSLITAKIKTRLIDDRTTNGFQIRVNTFKGVVFLTGYVESEYEKNHATRIVRSVDGVKQVNNNLIIRTNAQARR